MTTFKYQERFKTLSGVFDEFTNRNLFELQSKGFFDELVSPLKVGKESNVFLAVKEGTSLIVKIYRVQNCNFNQMYDYIRKDPRYEYLKKHRRDIIFAWTQREYRNLMLAQSAGIHAPQPLAFRHNILIETMIGRQEPALPLKDAYPAHPTTFFQEVVAQMKQLYQGGLIHGDLSSFNILNCEETPYFIDFSQSTVVETPNAEELLQRDIRNIACFFQKVGVAADEKEIFKRVTGKN